MVYNGTQHGDFGPLMTWWANQNPLMNVAWWRNGEMWPLMVQLKSSGPLMTQWGNRGPLDHAFFWNGLVRLHCTLSHNVGTRVCNLDILNFMQNERNTCANEAPILCFLFLVFCSFFLPLSLSLSPSLSLSLSLSFSLSLPPLVPGPPDIVHYATR